MKHLLQAGLGVTLIATLALAACRDQPGDKHPADDPGHRQPAAPNEGHDHGGEGSDLDRPVAELFAASCEHDKKTHQCDECRYEVGVVKAAASLFADGLLKRVKGRKKTIAVPLALTGVVRFDERRVAHVSTMASGIIRKVHVTLGDKVKRGQPLVELESVAVGEAEAAQLQAQAMLKLARHNHDRLAALRRDGIASEKELLGAKQALDAAEIQAAATLGKLTRLGMSPSTARALTQRRSRGRLVLRAPATGTVLEMHAVAGEIAQAERSMVTVGDNSALWIWADLYERDVALVSREQAKQPLAAEIEVRAFVGKRFPGKVDLVSPSMSESSRTVKLRIAVPNLGGRLLAGMFARVKIFLPSRRQALTVPSAAVLTDEGRSFVFIHYRDEYYVRRPVTAGQTFAGLTEISHGLGGDETIVSDGSFLLKSDVLRSKMGAGCAD